MMDTEASRQLVMDYYQAMQGRDGTALARVLADDVEWVPPASSPLEDLYVGRDRVIAAMPQEGERFFKLDTSRLDMRRIVADGDTVVVLYDYACTTVDGREYSNKYVWVFTCADGKIVRMDEHTDTLRLHRLVMEE